LHGLSLVILPVRVSSSPTRLRESLIHSTVNSRH
jgi:hypothetical protein